MRVLVTGDVADWNLPNFSISRLCPDMAEAIKRADCVVYNLEGPIDTGAGGALRLRENGIGDWCYQNLLKVTGKEQPIVSSTPRIVDLLTLNPSSVVCTANNHIKDLGPRALAATLDLLDRQGVKHTGAGPNLVQAREPVWLDEKVVLLNLNWIASIKFWLPFHVYDATLRGFGAAWWHHKALRQYVAKLQAQGNQVLLVLHGGMECPDSHEGLCLDLEQIAAIGANVTVVHHPHIYVSSPYESRDLFVIGDFVFCRPGKLPFSRPTATLEIDFGTEGAGAQIHHLQTTDIYDYHQAGGEGEAPHLSATGPSGDSPEQDWKSESV